MDLPKATSASSKVWVSCLFRVSGSVYIRAAAINVTIPKTTPEIHGVLSLLSFKTWLPKIDPIRPRPLKVPNPVQRITVGNNSLVYSYSPS